MKAGLRLVYPPHCLSCADSVEIDGSLCPVCWRDADFIAGTACSRCGAPLPDDGHPVAALAGPPDPGDDVICDDCLTVARPWEAGRAALVYAGTGRGLVLALKHGDRPDLGPPLGRWLAQAAAPLVVPGMVVAPVPLHFGRLVRRKYNQAAMLSAQVARVHGLAHLPDLLCRTRATPAQDHGSVADRFRNVAGALAINPRRADAAAGRPVLLVDDVMASGATLAAAAEALVAAGSGPVRVAVLCRAVRER